MMRILSCVKQLILPIGFELTTVRRRSDETPFGPKLWVGVSLRSSSDETEKQGVIVSKRSWKGTAYSTLVRYVRPNRQRLAKVPSVSPVYRFRENEFRRRASPPGSSPFPRVKSCRRRRYHPSLQPQRPQTQGQYPSCLSVIRSRLKLICSNS